MSRKIVTAYGLFQALTPLIHLADERMETTTICRYNTANLPDGTEFKIYNVSANSFRHTIREAAASRLLELVGVERDELPELVNVILLSGGPRLYKTSKDSSSRLPVRYSNAMCELFPMLELLGCTVAFCMVPYHGSRLSPTALNVLTPESGYFQIELEVLKRFGIITDQLPTVVTEFQFNTKRDTRDSIDDNSEIGNVANVLETQCIRKGTLLGHRVVISDRNDGLLSSCFASALAKWERDGCFIGGRRAQGAGVVSFDYKPGFGSSDIYEQYIDERRDAIAAILRDKKAWETEQGLFAYLS